MDHGVFRVIAHLRGAIAEDACMEHVALPEDLRVDSEAALEHKESGAQHANPARRRMTARSAPALRGAGGRSLRLRIEVGLP